MKKRRGNLLGFLLTLALFFGLSSGIDSPAHSETLNSSSTTWSENSTITDDVTINSSVDVTGNITLTIPEGKTLTVNGGITAAGYTLTVSGEGKLNVTGAKGSNGILLVNSNGGTGGYGIKGSIIVNSGIITLIGGTGGDSAEGGNGGAGGDGISGNLTVNGGTINITGGGYGSGGSDGMGGPDGDGGDGISGSIIVNGGSVTVRAGDGSNGGDGISGSIIVNGGSVTVTASNGSNGGDSDDDEGGNGGNGGNGISGNITVHNGSITVTGGSGGKGGKGGMGSPDGQNGSNGRAVTGTITASTVEDSDDNSNWSTVSSGTSSKRYVKAQAVHNHNFTYTASGDTITATCSENGCWLTDSKAALTIIPASSGGGTAELSGDIETFGVSNADITYQAKDGSGWKDIASSGITSTGSYKASITVGNVTASITYGVYTITKGTGAGNGCDFTVPTVANVGAKIQPELTLATGYEVKKITVIDTTNQTDVSATVSADTEGFIMPDYNVTVSVAFGKIDYAINYSSMSNGTVSADKITAQYGDTVTLTVSPDYGYELKSITVKDSESVDVSVTSKDNVYSFTMPASSVTVSATFEGLPFTLTISDTITHGAVTTFADSVKTGSEVTLTVKPFAGYNVSSVTATTKTGSTSVSVTKDSDTIYKFTMPADEVTVSATFAARSVSISFDKKGSYGTGSRVALLDENYDDVSDSLTKKASEDFILYVNTDDGYGFDFSFSSGEDASGYITEFTKEEYKAYFEYAKENNISVPSNTYLFHVTMPGVDADDMTISVTFAREHTFTVLYQPEGKPSKVWSKIILTENDKDTSYVMAMKSDAAMGNGTAVWSLKATAAFDPSKVAFLAGESSADLANATMTNVSVVQKVPADSDWTSITNNGKFCVIGGNSKTFIASFVSDGSSVTVYQSDTASSDVAESADGVMYRVAVCLTNDSGDVTTAGTVTAPKTTYTKTGYDFAGWRGFEGTAPNLTEKIYSAEDSISITENTTLTAVWNIQTPSITLNRNGGTGGTNVTSVPYGSSLTLSENPTREGYAFDGWTVSETVTEDGTLFARGSLFDLSTKITADLKLTAQWKHVHSYTGFRVTLFSGLSAYHEYDSSLHIAVCDCGNIKLMAHEFDNSGKCSCGYEKPTPPSSVTLNISYGQWLNGTYIEKMQGMPETTKPNQEVSIFAPNSLGDLQFSKWQYSTDNTTWSDFTAYTYASFIIPCDMRVRALYINPVTKPKVDLSARLYADSTVVDGKTYQMDNILFHMNYKLPDGYSFVDAGIRLGDNAGISYYEMKERRYTMDTEAKAIATGLVVAVSLLDQSINTFDSSATDTYYEEHTNSVLDEMSAETLAKYMYESKPINVEKYDPIYWEAKAVTKGMSGSMATYPPLRFAQKNNQNHYIYGIAYLRYKNSSGTIETIYTPALAATVNNIPSNTVTKEGN